MTWQKHAGKKLLKIIIQDSNFSILAIVDANYNFIFIDVGAFGKESSGTIFRKMTLYQKLENNRLNILRSISLPGTEQPNLPYTFIGDKAFSLCPYMMRPYSGKSLAYKKKYLVIDYRVPDELLKGHSVFYQINGKFSTNLQVWI